MSADRVTLRRAYQHHVASLLAELEERRQQLYRLQARGAQAAGLRDLKDELGMLQRRLAQLERLGAVASPTARVVASAGAPALVSTTNTMRNPRPGRNRGLRPGQIHARA